jgi:hypothetical protein
MTYAQIFQAGLMLVIALKVYGIPLWSYPIIFTGTLLLFVGFGYMDSKFGWLKKETELLNEHNPQIQELLNK